MRYFKVKLVNNYVYNDKGNVVETGFGYPEGWDAHKINVRAYKSFSELENKAGADYCIAETDNEVMCETLLKSKNVTELDLLTANALIDDARPIIEVVVQVHPKAVEKVGDIKSQIETFLTSKNLSFKVE